MTKNNTCDKVAKTFDEKREQGLLDVKFLLKNRSDISHTEACEGFAAFQKEIAEGNSQPLDFGDLNWK